MKFGIYGREFKSLVDRIGGIVPKRTALPTLETVKISAHDNMVEFQATDMTDYATIITYANVYEDGAVWVYLSDLKKALAITDDLTITAEHGKLDIRSAKKSYEIPCHDDYEDTWATFPVIDNNNILCRQMDNEFLKHLSVIDCARSTESSNMIMTGFYLDLINQKLVALDGYRIGIAKLHGMFVPNSPSLILNGSVYTCLKSLIGKSKEKYIEIYADKKHVKFVGEDFEYISRLMDGNYFDYKKLVEPAIENSEYTYKVNPKELFKISKEYSKVISSDNKLPMIIYNVNGSVATGVQVQNYRTSDVLESVECEHGMSHEWHVGVNPRFIVDACAAFKDEAEIKGNYNYKNPIMLIDETYEFLILPVNINDVDVEFVKRQVA